MEKLSCLLSSAIAKRKKAEPRRSSLKYLPASMAYGGGICAWAIFEYALSPDESTAVVA